MTEKTIVLTHEQIELAQMLVESDRALGRTTDPLVALIAAVSTEPVTVESVDGATQVHRVVGASR